MATLNLGRVRGDKGEDSTVPGPRGIPGPPGPQGPAGTPGPKGEDATPVNLGSAATKDVGTGTEQIPQNKNLGSAAFKNIRNLHKDLFEQYPQEKLGASYDLNSDNQFPLGDRSLIAQGVLNSPALIFGGDYYYVETKPYDTSNRFQIAIGYSSSIVVTRRTNGSVATWSPWILSGQSPDTVTKDPTGNVAVLSIQAGAGAPKVKHAFFNSTNVAGPGSIASVALGIPYNKILAISCLLGKTTTKYPPNHSDFADKALYYVKLVRVASDMAAVQFILATGDQSSSLYYATTQIFVTYTE